MERIRVGLRKNRSKETWNMTKACMSSLKMSSHKREIEEGEKGE